jgi:regulator of sigma E protease
LTVEITYRRLSYSDGIAQDSRQIPVVVGVELRINLAAVWCAGIGLLNLFSLPMLDGGHPLYYGIETVRGRPLGERAQAREFADRPLDERSA